VQLDLKCKTTNINFELRINSTKNIQTIKMNYTNVQSKHNEILFFNNQNLKITLMTTVCCNFIN